MKIKVLFLFIVLTSIAIVLFSVDQTWETEPNNYPGQANILGSSGDYPCGFQTFDTSLYGDDYYRFSATIGQTVDVVGNAYYPTNIGLIITDMSDFYLFGPVDSYGQGHNENINGFAVPATGDYCVVAYEANQMKGSGYTYSLQVTILDPTDTVPPTYPGGIAGIQDVIRFSDNTADVHWYQATDASPFHYNIYVYEGVVSVTTLFATAPYKQVDAPASFTTVTGINSSLTYTFGVRAEDIYNNMELNTNILISNPPTSVNGIWEVYE